MMRSLSFGLLAFAALAACKRNDSPVEARPVPTTAASSVSTSTDASVHEDASVSAVVDSAVPMPVAKGSATLVVQRVDTECSTGPGETHRSFLGHDVLVEILVDGEKKPVKVFPLCLGAPSTDGGTKPPRLDTWEMCHAFPKCTIVPNEASPDRVEAQCGKETITLESTSQGTVVKGSFGERVISPLPLRIAPAKRTNRTAYVDC